MPSPNSLTDSKTCLNVEGHRLATSTRFDSDFAI